MLNIYIHTNTYCFIGFSFYYKNQYIIIIIITICILLVPSHLNTQKCMHFLLVVLIS